MYSRLPAFVFGFHGCDKATKEAVLHGGQQLDPSRNTYDWLGSGIYFWEQNPDRALAFARKACEIPGKYTSKPIIDPAVIGAVIDLGNCMNLMDAIHIERLSDVYGILKEAASQIGAQLPTNHGKGDRPLRELDRAVIEALHQIMRTLPGKFQPYDTVRGLFLEGEDAFPGSGFKRETHIQICVRNIDCIKAYFDPRGKASAPFIV